MNSMHSMHSLIFTASNICRWNWDNDFGILLEDSPDYMFDGALKFNQVSDFIARTYGRFVLYPSIVICSPKTILPTQNLCKWGQGKSKWRKAEEVKWMFDNTACPRPENGIRNFKQEVANGGINPMCHAC